MRLNCGFVYDLLGGVASLVACPLGRCSLPGGVILCLSLYCRCDRRLLSFSQWDGHRFTIHQVVVQSLPPPVCGIKLLAINDALLLE